MPEMMVSGDATDAGPRAKAKAKAKAQSVRHQNVLVEIRDARQILKNELKSLRKKSKQDSLMLLLK
jgi:hypothetical protein